MYHLAWPLFSPRSLRCCCAILIRRSIDPPFRIAWRAALARIVSIPSCSLIQPSPSPSPLPLESPTDLPYRPRAHSPFLHPRAVSCRTLAISPPSVKPPHDDFVLRYRRTPTSFALTTALFRLLRPRLACQNFPCGHLGANWANTVAVIRRPLSFAGVEGLPFALGRLPATPSCPSCCKPRQEPLQHPRRRFSR